MVVQLLSPLSVVLDALIFLAAGFSALSAYGARAPACLRRACGSAADAPQRRRCLAVKPCN